MRKLSQLRLLTWYKVDYWGSRIKHLQQHMVVLRDVTPVLLPHVTKNLAQKEYVTFNTWCLRKGHGLAGDLVLTASG